MRKTLLPIVIIGTLIAACGEAMTSASTATILPPSVTPAPNPLLIAEIKLETETGTAYTLDWNRDGKMLAAASGAEVTLLSADLKEIQAVLRPEGGALGITWSPGETQFATVNGFRNPSVTLWEWDSANAQLTRAKQIQAGVDQYGVAWSPDGNMLATLAGDRKSVFQIWDTSTSEEIRKFDLPYTNPRRALNWSPDSSTLYDAGEMNGKLTVFALNMTDGTVKELANFPSARAELFAISTDAKRFAIADGRGIVGIVDAASGDLLHEFKSVDQPVDLVWNPNGLTLAILSYEGTLQLWEIPH